MNLFGLIRFCVTMAVVLVSLPAVAKDFKVDKNVRVEKDVSYLGEKRTEKLDLYFPKKIKKGSRLPAVVIIHGGGWIKGDKASKRERNIGSNLAKAGYVCASINYVLADGKKKIVAERLGSAWPQNLHDCKTAVRFLRKNAEKYHIDPDHIGVIGGSAGGHLTAMVGMTDADDGLNPKGPYGKFSCQVQAIVPMYGIHDIVARERGKQKLNDMTKEQQQFCKMASPVTYASKNDPPTLILHGTSDKIVAVEQSELLHAALEKAGASSQLVIIPKAPHTFHLQPRQRDLRPLVIGFFDKHLKEKHGR